MRVLLLTYLVIGFLKQATAQQQPAMRIALDQYIQDEKSRKLQAIIAVYKYTGQPFEDPATIGVETKREAGKFYARLPLMNGITDTSYAYIFFGGVAERKDLPGYSLVIIGNNKRDSRPALLWIDRNHNLDLSDDGAPDTFPSGATDKEITLYNPKLKNAAYTVNLSRFSFSYNSKYIDMLDKYYAENSGTRKFAGALYCFKEQRYNIIGGDYKNGNDSFRIGIKDQNCNGIYNEPGKDFILIGDYLAPVLPDDQIPLEEKAGKTFFERNGKRFLIDRIDALGAYISIREDIGAKVERSLVVGKKIRKFRFQTTDKVRKTMSVRSYRKKPLYIYVWRFGQPGFSDDTAALRIIARDYADKISVLALNYGEKPKELLAFKRRNNINWNIGQSTRKINEQLYIEHLPYGLLLGKKLKVRQVKISPSELLLLLQNNTI